MVAVSFYFQVHQPYRLRQDFDFFCIGTDKPYEDDEKNREIVLKVARKCYLPANRLMLELIRQNQGRFRIAYSISGVALEQFEAWCPEVIESFRELVQTGCVELLSETYYHSLAYLFSEKEFVAQVQKHQQLIKKLFGVKPTSFRNTELIYNNGVAQLAEKLGFRAILAEGADRVLGWRSPNFVYTPAGAHQIALLMKNYRLSDDIAFRFSERSWSEWPLTTDKYASWLHQVAGNGEVVNLFMDYETFGEHQWEESGVFEFLRHLPAAVLKHPDFEFLTPSEVAAKFRPKAELDIEGLVSWADAERDVSAWLGNHLQDAAAAYIYRMEREVLSTKDENLIHAWRKLQTSDHFYYMCTKFFNDGDVHKYFSPYHSPYDAFIFFQNAANQLQWAVKQRLAEIAPRAPKRRPTVSKRSIAKATPTVPVVVPVTALDQATMNLEGKRASSE
jgi:alpha-amylase